MLPGRHACMQTRHRAARGRFEQARYHGMNRSRKARKQQGSGKRQRNPLVLQVGFPHRLGMCDESLVEHGIPRALIVEPEIDSTSLVTVPNQSTPHA